MTHSGSAMFSNILYLYLLLGVGVKVNNLLPLFLYGRRCERLVGLEGLALAALPPNLGNVPSADFEYSTVRIRTFWVGDG